MRQFIQDAIERGVAQWGVRVDAGETLAYARSLEQILTGNYDYRYPAAKATELFAVDRSLDPGAKTYTYRQVDIKGDFIRIANWASDFPSVTAQGFEVTAGVDSFGGSYSYSLQDMRQAKFGNIPLDATLARAVRMVAANRVESLAATGWADSQGTGRVNPIWGMLNTPNVPVLIPNLSVTGSTGVASVSTAHATNALDFHTATPEQIAATFDAVAGYTSNTTKGLFKISRCVLPLDAYNALASRKWSPTYGTDSVLTAILKQSAYIKSIESWQRCSGAGLGSDGSGATGTGRAIFDDGVQADYAKIMLPVEFEQFAPQIENLAWTIPCHMRSGGAFVPHPFSMAYLDGFGF